MSGKLSFNDIILRLLTYWKEQDCLIWQPYNIQVGAGTMNPATILRVLGPEPWNVVYVEPSIRPDDGRFGENPNRMQQHYQLQVILKPDPGNPQELYLESLEAIGIDPRQHDMRFVEDNWQSPAMGAWGLGWEVWLDGQEITQFTYFQQAGGHDLDPVSVEITYGLDRIALALQDVDSVWQLDYGAGISYGDVLLQAEVEHCHYYFNGADVEALRQVYDTYENEARRNLGAGLVVPAHDYNLKCSQLFNILDTRGAIGVTERAQYFRRMRNVAREISALYLKQRQEMGYPFLKHSRWARRAEEPVLPPVPASPSPAAQTFLLEIGCEELPVADFASARAQLGQALSQLLADLRLGYAALEVQGTPRRLVALVSALAPRQADLETLVKGPPADRAFDAQGKPTRAALGFARGKGVEVADLRLVEDEKGRYAAALVREEGRPAQAALAERLPELVASLKFEKSMRWNWTNVAFSRPLRWFVALYGEEVVPFAYAGIVSGRYSRGLRPHGAPEIIIDQASEYAAIMARNGIMIDPEARQAAIQQALGQMAAPVGGVIQPDDALLEEVANLVEQPTPLLGHFEEKYLALPAEALVAVMKKHQRYFPVYHPEGGLLPYFITVRNGDREGLDLVRHGNEHVIRARFADADFFYHKDISRSLESFVPALHKLTFQAELGSMYDKVRRLEKLVPAVADMLGLSPADRAVAARAAALCKADLATSLVVEMTSLQGVMGGHYARRSGEPEAVATAMAEQYQAVSSTPASLALALADRLDSLAGLFAAGLAPKGSNDPFALRRAAIQLIENLLANQVDLDLRPAIRAAAELLPLPCGPETRAEVLAFIAGRLEVLLRERGLATNGVKAVLAEQGHNPYRASQTAADLDAIVQGEGWPPLLDAYARCVRITRGLEQQYTLRPDAFNLPAEQALLTVYQQASAAADGTLACFVTWLRRLEPAITRFFEDVLVMDQDQALRENRLALLQAIARLPQGIVDLSLLEGF